MTGPPPPSPWGQVNALRAVARNPRLFWLMVLVVVATFALMGLCFLGALALRALTH